MISFLDLLKLFYHDPRPCVSFNEVISRKCEPDYGNPSGHSMVIPACIILPPYIIDKSFYMVKCLKHLLLFIIEVALIFFILLSRIILGMHSINQVVLGCAYGLAFSIIFISYIFPLLVKYTKFLEEGKSAKIKNLIIISIVFILYLAAAIISYEIDFRHYD